MEDIFTEFIFAILPQNCKINFCEFFLLGTNGIIPQIFFDRNQL